MNMGSNASRGSDNDELVDNLLRDQYLKTPSIQQIFRAVDRGLYFTKESRKRAYDDGAWRSGNIHLSAPGIYCEVLENLELGEGMSFLNLGSGTGYLNTMAGLIIGSYGVNYGVEVHKEVIEYAQNRLEKFKWTAEAIDEYDFCEPKFFEGNCLHLSCENKLYDRVYCGAACPPSYENYMKNLIKVTGILVMPLEDVLVRVKRTSKNSWEKKTITPVNFANMILPSPCDANKPQLLLANPEPLSLQVICRTSIRQILINIIREENPKLKSHRIRKELLFPARQNDSDDLFDELLEGDPSFQMFLFHKNARPLFSRESPDNDDSDDDDEADDKNREEDEADRRDSDESEGEESKEMERNEKETDGEEESDDDKIIQKKREDGPGETSPSLQRHQARLKRKKARHTSTSSSDSGADVEDMDAEDGRSSSIEGESRKKTDSGEKGLKVDSTSESCTTGDTGESSAEKSSDGAACSSNLNVGSSDESDDDDDEEDDDDEDNAPSSVRYGKLRKMMVRQYMASLRKFNKIQVSPRVPDKEQSEDEGRINEPPTVSPSYSVLMREKIQALPLPFPVQSYLNFHRTF